MADLFWGVSDALDLYSEYLQVLKTKEKKLDKAALEEKPPNEIKRKEDEKATEPSNEETKGNEENTSNEEKQGQQNQEEENLQSNDTNKAAEDQPVPQVLETDNATATTNDDSVNETTVDGEQLETSNDIESSKIGAGDAKPCHQDDDENSKAKESTKLNLEKIPEMNFNPILEPSPPCDDNDSNTETPDETLEHKPPTINILIFGGGDPRHVIKTMAKRYSHLKDEGNACSAAILKFYMIDGCVEIIARNMVLLGIALERPELISLRNKVHLFMDVYGNTLLRPICHQYLVSKSATLLKMVSDKSVLEQMAPFLNLDNLKYRERDGLQDTFEFWSPKPGYDFNIKDYWMARLRRLLAVRYDCRDGVFDWDLNMSLKSRGAEQICPQEYKYWRETGIAFTFPEYEQSKPNKTLATGLVRNGSRYVHRGYIGDIQTGPFCTFGLRSEEERLHRSAHGENDYRATEVTERNLLEYFFELQNGSPYVHNTEMSNKYGGVRFHMGERLVYDEHDLKGICAYDQPWISVEGFEVHFLSMAEAKPLAKAAGQWEDFFDVAFVGYKFFDLLEDTFPKVLCKNGLLILETKLRSTEIKSRIAEFEAELFNFAREANLEQAINYNALNKQNPILKFIKN